MKFKTGDRVIHPSWGEGAFINYGDTESECFVEFFNETEFGNIVCVSVALLKLSNIQ